MANENINPGQGQPAKPLGTGEGESPIMPQSQGPQVGMRTMSSDKSSVMKGDMAPKTYAPQTPSPASMQSNTPPQASTPSDSSFSSQSFDLPQIDMGSSPSITPKTPKSKKGVFVALVAFIVVVGLAAIGYFVVYPMLAGPAATAPVTNNTPEQTPSELPSLPTTPVETPTSTTETPTSTENTATTTPTAVHTSPFKTPLDGSLNSPSAITGANLSSVTLPSSKNPGLFEVVYQDNSGNLISFNDIMHALFGADFSSGALQNAFVATSTSGFIYTDAQGNKTLGIVAIADPSSSLAAVKSAFAQVFEANQNLKNIFANDPGAQNTWQSGQTNGVVNRYITFANSGFSINYGWSGTTLVISSSYNGFKAILGHLQ